MTRYAFFDTDLGRCAVAWRGLGIVAVQLPDGGEGGGEGRLRRRFADAEPGDPPPEVRRAVEAMTALLAGQHRDLAHVPLDFSEVGGFERRVYDAARAIPPGEVRTYAQIAAEIGDPGAAQAVGKALGRNPFPIVVPCHRVVAADGKAGGFSAPGGRSTKLRLLSVERARRSTGQPDLFG